MRKKIMCCLMVLVLCVGTLQPKEAHAVAIADDAVVIICCLLAAAGITFATSDGVTDAVSDFLDQSGGKFDSLLSQLASNRVVRAGHEVIMLPMELASQVRGLLRGLYDYFIVGDDRTGSVTVPVDSSLFCTEIQHASAYVPESKIYSNVYCFLQASESGTHNMYFFWIARDGVYCTYWLPDGRISYSNKRLLSYNFASASSFGFCPDSSGNLSVFADDSIVYTNKAFSFVSFIAFDPFAGYSSTTVVRLFENVSYVSGSKGTMLDTRLSMAADMVPLMLSRISSLGFTPLPLGYAGETDGTLSYGLTFPEELTYEDVLDRFEERLEAAAGDLAIALPQTGVVDNTLTYQEAQEQVLVNVNELGEVTDTTTETNTWLQKLLVSVKAIPATVIGTGSLDFDAFKGLSLTSVFPFCIPFDLKNALLSFNAVPADPVWSIDFAGTFMEPAGSLEIDMTEFESLFKIVRFFIYGGFVVSLILLTRKIIKG